MRKILTNLKQAAVLIADAITAIESIGWIEIPGAPGYFYNGIKIRHRMKNGSFKPIKLSQNMFSTCGKRWYVSVNGGEIKQCK